MFMGRSNMQLNKNKTVKLALSIVLIAIIAGFFPIGTAASFGTHRVWNDLNGNGIQDEIEPCGISGVTVELHAADGTLVDSTTTDANGNFIFFNVPYPNGYYYEKYIAPSGYVFTLKDQGTDEYLDSDADPMTGKTNIVGVGEGNVYCAWDAGLISASTGGGLTPGFWKHNVGVYLTSVGVLTGAQAVNGAYSDPVNSLVVTKATMGDWLDAGWTDTKLLSLYNDMKTIGGGAEGAATRNNAANVFNAAAGLALL